MWLLQQRLSYPRGFLIRVDASFSTCGEVAEHFDGVSCAALIWINPVFAWETETSEKHSCWGGMRTDLAFLLLNAKKEFCSRQLVQLAIRIKWNQCEQTFDGSRLLEYWKCFFHGTALEILVDVIF